MHLLANGTERYFTDLSIWDIFRTQLPLLGLWQPVVMRDVMRTLVSMYEQYGGVPTWPFADTDAGTMSGRCKSLALNSISCVNILMGIRWLDCYLPRAATWT